MVRTVGLPENIWGRLATVAEMRGVKVDDMLADAVVETMRPKTRKEQVVLLAQAGWTDKQIADHSGELVGFCGKCEACGGYSGAEKEIGNERHGMEASPALRRSVRDI